MDLYFLYFLTCGSISCQPKSVQNSTKPQAIVEQVNNDTIIIIPEQVLPIQKSEEEWKKSLPEMAHFVLREKEQRGLLQENIGITMIMAYIFVRVSTPIV